MKRQLNMRALGKFSQKILVTWRNFLFDFDESFECPLVLKRKVIMSLRHEKDDFAVKLRCQVFFLDSHKMIAGLFSTTFFNPIKS